MQKYDIVIRSERGALQATLYGEPGVPTGLLLQAVMTHEQLVPHLTELEANSATTILITTPSRQELPPGLTVVFHDGVNINGPIYPSPVGPVPEQFRGITITHTLAALVTYSVDL